MQTWGVEVRLGTSQQKYMFNQTAVLQTFTCVRKREGGKLITTFQIVVEEADQAQHNPMPSRRVARNNQRSDKYFAKRAAQGGRLSSPPKAAHSHFDSRDPAKNYSPKTVIDAGAVQSAPLVVEVAGRSADHISDTGNSSEEDKNASSGNEAIAKQTLHGEIAVSDNSCTSSSNEVAMTSATSASLTTSGSSIDGSKRPRFGLQRRISRAASEEWTLRKDYTRITRDRYLSAPRQERERWARGGPDSPHVWFQDGFFYKHDPGRANFATGFIPLEQAPGYIRHRVERWALQVHHRGCLQHQLCQAHKSRWEDNYCK